MKNKIKQTSKLLSLLLRHQPQAAGLTLDEAGWADVEELIEKVSLKYYPVELALIQKVVETNEKQRFAFNQDQTKIRASQGHSLPVELALVPTDPPNTLYHGTATTFLDLIRKEGLNRMSRQHVHLSAEASTARQVGSRHGTPVILAINAQKMLQDEFNFYRSDNGVWLTEQVPARYIQF